MIDGWLLEAFPGRTLEELDNIDLNRVLRAKAAKKYESVEARVRLFKAGKLKASDLTADELRVMAEMDAIEAQEL